MPYTIWKQDQAIWVIFQQLLTRGIIAVKFLLAAKILGPDKVGEFGIVLLSAAVIESVTDTGIQQAVIQSTHSINRDQAGAVWTLQLARGAIAGLILFLLATPISSFFGTPQTSAFLMVAAVILLTRCSVNPGVFLLQRNRNFRAQMFFESGASLIDLSITLMLLMHDFGLAALLIGSLSGESIRSLISWLWIRTEMSINIQWSVIKDFTDFGKWIWGSNIITLVLNQTDKALVAKFLGTHDFGLYQLASRVAQLIFSDAANALSQYLFPTLSRKNRQSKAETKVFLYSILKITIPTVIIVCLLVALLSEYFITKFLGPSWLPSAALLNSLAIVMALGSIITILATYARAIGKPQYVTIATFYQLLALILIAPFLCYYFKAQGMIVAMGLAGIVTTVLISIKLKSHV